MTSVASLVDVDAEECVVGACLLAPRACEEALSVLTPADFGSQRLSAAFDAVCAVHHRGHRVDPVTVSAELKVLGRDWDGAPADLLEWRTNATSAAHVGAYAAVVIRNSARRALYGVGTELVHAAQDPLQDPGDVADATKNAIAAIDSPALATSPGDVEVAELLAEPPETNGPPVVPGLLSEDDRVVVVAPEGKGKSELTRQFVTLPAFGIHPLTFGRIPSRPGLIVDLENPRSLVRSRMRALVDQGRRVASEREEVTLWHRPGGIDLRKRADRLAFEDVLRRRRPSLVALGPVYKSYSRRSSETDEQVAAEVQAVLDDLRTRFRFALLLEHHAPQASGGVRDLRPFGSSLWLRWPEFGLKLKPDGDDDRVLRVERWRGDRVRGVSWPDTLERGTVWPWEGRWADGF